MATHEFLTERWLEKKLRLQGAFLEWKGRSYNMRMIQHSEIVADPWKAGKYRNMLYLYLLQWILISATLCTCALHWLNAPAGLIASITIMTFIFWKKIPPMRPVLYIRLFHSSITVPIQQNEIPQAEAFLEKILKAGECK